MITEEDIKRINELYHKSQNEGLTDAEKEEQQNLRKAYIEAMRGNIKSQLDSIVVQRPDGTREKLKRKKRSSRFLT
jgi:5-formyltetrahydrofolate cyclo-ligase